MTEAKISPVAVTDLARYITEVTKRNEFLEVRVQELLEANNAEVESRRHVQAVLRDLIGKLRDIGITDPVLLNKAKEAATTYRPKPEETNGNSQKENKD